MMEMMEMYGGLVLFLWIIGGSCVAAAFVAAKADRTVRSQPVEERRIASARLAA